MKRWQKVLCIGMSVLCLAGCGKNRDDDLSKDYQKNNLEGDTSADGNSISGHLEYELVSESEITFTVDVDVTGGDRLADSYCYGAKPAEFDETYLKEHVYAAFDEGTVQSVKPREVSSEQELKDRQMELRQRQQELQEQADLEDTMNAIMEKGLQADLESVENYLEQPSKETFVAGTGETIYTMTFPDKAAASFARADGEIAGVPYVYEMYYYDSEKSGVSSNVRYMRYDMYSPMYASGIYVRTKTDADEVKGLDLKDAESRAYDFLVNIGYADFSCYEVGIGAKLEEDTDSASMQSDMVDRWYCFSYTRVKDGIPFAASAGAWDLQFGVEEELSAPLESILVAVDEHGVAVVNMQGIFYNVEEKGTKIESYLSLEQIDAAAQKYMQNFEKTDFYANAKKITVDQVKLNYVYVHYTDGNYNVIPVWAYYGYPGEDRERFLFGVSAVDGQIIEGQYLMYMYPNFVL